MSNQTFLEFIGAKNRVPNGYWKDIENCKIYMKWLGRKLGYKTTEDWYKVSGKNFKDNNGDGLVTNIYKGYINLIKSVFPDYEWLEWKFVCAPNRFWKDIKNQKKYLLWLVNKLGYKTQEDIYKLTTIDFIDNYGKGLIWEIGSFPNLIKSVFPEYVWLEWKFNVTQRGFWEDKKNHKKYLLWLGEQLGYKTIADWYKVSGKNFRDNYGQALVAHYYNGCHINLIKSVFPDYEWLEWKFSGTPKKFWEDKKNQKRYIIWLGKALGYTTMEEWYNIGAIHFRINNGGGLLDKFYKKFNYEQPLYQLIIDTFPEHKWDIGKFNNLKTERKMHVWLNKYVEKLFIENITHGYRPEWADLRETHNTYYIFDFNIELTNGVKIIIEIDGAYHYKQVWNWSSPEYVQQRDRDKEKLAKENHHSLIRLNQEDVLSDKNNWEDNLIAFISYLYYENIQNPEIYDCSGKERYNKN